MYDIYYISDRKNAAFGNLKQKFPLLKHATSFQEAQDRCLTEFFWIVWDDLIVDDNFEFDYVPDNWSKQYVHVFLNDKHFDGIVLCPKHKIINHKEISHRFFIEKKEIEIVASTPRPYDVFEIDSYDEYVQALETSTTEMFWMSSKNISAVIPEIYFDHSNSYDRNINHVFVHKVDNKEMFNGLFLCSKNNKLTQKEIEHRHIVHHKEWDIVASGPKLYDVFNANSYEEYLEALENSKTEMFWIIPNYVSVDENFKFDIYFSHDQVYERSINHVYLNGEYHDGVILCSKKSRISKREFDYRFISHKKESASIASMPKPYDIVFISYQEPNADQNYQLLKDKFPQAKRVHGVKGIHQAHIEAAKLCETDMFWIVDGDAVLVDDFNFNYQVARWDRETVHVWRSINPINDLVYGYGGVKLFPRQLTLSMDVTKTDMTTSISSKFKQVPEISNVTAFNTDPFNTWKSAFRECVKLSSGIIDRQDADETAERLFMWKLIGENKPFGKYAIEGAKAGEMYGAEHKNNVSALSLINDFDWLYGKFSDVRIQ